MVYKLKGINKNTRVYRERAIKIDKLDIKIKKVKELIILERIKLNKKKLKDALKIKARLVKKIKKGLEDLQNG